ncbi:MAG: c-type cytochrome [Anaerolineae bacterium]|nr:c-type cytochrome [Anaerolineae bacterium]
MFKQTLALAAILLAGLLLSACVGAVPELTPIPSLEPPSATPMLADALQTPPAGGEAEAEAGAGAGEAVDLETALSLFEQNCQACHGEMGKEGTVGPALYASAAVQAMSTDEIHGIIANGVQGTAMSSYAGTFSDAELSGLVALIQSWQEGATGAVAEPAGPVDALGVYEANCQSCHGEMGEDALVGPNLANNPQVAALGAEKIQDIVTSGIEGTSMVGFTGVLSEAEIAALVELVQGWNAGAEVEATAEPTGEVGAADLGAALTTYQANCQSCHGENGKDALVGPDLASNPAVAALAHDKKLDIIHKGIAGTAMVGFEGVLSEDEINGLIALVESWNAEGAAGEATEAPTEEAAAPGEEAAFALYGQKCASCHGENGKGALVGPDLAGNADLAEMSAEDIHAIIANGVEGTAMVSFSGALTAEEIDQLVTLIQSWQEE